MLLKEGNFVQAMKRVKNAFRFFYYLLKYDAPVVEWFNIVVESDISSKAKLLGSHHISHSYIDDYSYIALNAQVSYTNIGKYCSIGPNFVCGWGIHPITAISTSPMFYSSAKQNGFSICQQNKIIERKQIRIGHDVFIGANVIVLDGVSIGNGAVIGAGAVVSKDIPPYAIAVGCPIQIVKYRFDKAIIERLESIQWWNNPSKYHSQIEESFFNIEKFIKDND